ncbi:AraC family transcriptional regulator [Vibrio campbellii]|uniref:Helix-turn-helix transcriptional regulator n=1 Tax=Vibrio campbellii TaxID=680 RepID=A0ABY5IBI5_9VIBR|nr:AraC family transcriptional regulator [Vibrio campbellii]UTZ21930.1 helix-turn-helix transcriptional regulator [Vibrio campbellii]UTZ30658.1 helix-turn-helix transcriptional regulator [Vibrio campbellii]
MSKGNLLGVKKQRVFNVLTDNTAQLHKELWLDNCMGSAVWSNSHGSASYDRPSHHTLSFYLEGGQNTQRVMSSGNLCGGVNKLCLMPQDHHSDWTFSVPFRFFHFYFEQAHLQSFAEQVFDKEGRHIELSEQTYVEDAFVSQLIRETVLKLNWDSPTDKLMMSHSQQLLLLHLIRQYCHNSPKSVLSLGGLSTINQRRVVDYIQENLSKSFTLSDLASLSHLSEFHFARMFKASFGCTPHQYVLSQRVGMAKHLLSRHSMTLADIALSCGFSSQQHLSQQFKQRVGITPTEFRRKHISTSYKY